MGAQLGADGDDNCGASWFDYVSVQLASQDCYKDKMRDMADDYVCFFDTLGRRKSVIKKNAKFCSSSESLQW